MAAAERKVSKMMRTSSIVGIFALLVGATGCQSDGGGEIAPVEPGSTVAAGTDTAAVPAAPGALPVSPAAPGVKQAAKPLKTSFDGSPEEAANSGGQVAQAPGADPMAAGGAAAKPKPIGVASLKGVRADPFVSFYQFIIEKPPAYSLAVPERLAPPARPVEVPAGTTRPEDLLPLPQVARRVAGVLYNGAITAILETGEPPNSETAVISPGAKVPSGVPGIPELTVDSIAMDRLILRAEDGRTVEVKLSALPPSVQQSLSSQFGGGGSAAPGGGMPGGGGFGGGGGAKSGGGSAGSLLN